LNGNLTSAIHMLHDLQCCAFQTSHNILDIVAEVDYLLVRHDFS
jgi:hypothetical protein